METHSNQLEGGAGGEVARPPTSPRMTNAGQTLSAESENVNNWQRDPRHVFAILKRIAKRIKPMSPEEVEKYAQAFS